jgi:hypothetical protein
MGVSRNDQLTLAPGMAVIPGEWGYLAVRHALRMAGSNPMG